MRGTSRAQRGANLGMVGEPTQQVTIHLWTSCYMKNEFLICLKLLLSNSVSPVIVLTSNLFSPWTVRCQAPDVEIQLLTAGTEAVLLEARELEQWVGY